MARGLSTVSLLRAACPALPRTSSPRPAPPCRFSIVDLLIFRVHCWMIRCTKLVLPTADKTLKGQCRARWRVARGSRVVVCSFHECIFRNPSAAAVLFLCLATDLQQILNQAAGRSTRHAGQHLGSPTIMALLLRQSLQGVSPSTPG